MGTARPPDTENLIGAGCVDIAHTELQGILKELSAEARSCALDALSDINGAKYCAFDSGTNTAYCFQRRGNDFFYQYWASVRDQCVAEKLFAEVPEVGLPFSANTAERIYRNASDD